MHLKSKPITPRLLKPMSTTDHNPIGITMGCPAGIGPEIIIKYFATRNKLTSPAAVVIGDAEILAKTAEELNLQLPIHRYAPGANPDAEGIIVIQPPGKTNLEVVPGRPDVAAGNAMMSYLETAISLWFEGFLGGITTCPISKESMHNAGYNFPGHTEFLAARTGSDTPVMMMAGTKLKITLVTIHCALNEVSPRLSQNRVEHLIDQTQRGLIYDFGIKKPRIAVAGLNPHAGESGLFGSEESELITPAISCMQNKGIDVFGPFPPDTIFFKAAAGEFDVVICMYHDQGLIPFKLLHFNDGVNVTLGLPIIRTSVDHGTAYDIAGKGLADFTSLKAAVEMAALIGRNRRSSKHEYDQNRGSK